MEKFPPPLNAKERIVFCAKDPELGVGLSGRQSIKWYYNFSIGQVIAHSKNLSTSQHCKKNSAF